MFACGNISQSCWQPQMTDTPTHTSANAAASFPYPSSTVQHTTQTCFVNPYASETFISPQAIINSSAGSFDKWQMEGFLQGRPGILSLYSPSGLLKMSIQLSQQDGLYYSSTDTFTVDTNPRSWSSPLIGSAFTDLPPDLHFIDDNDSSACSDNNHNNDIPPAAPAVLNDDPRTATIPMEDATGSPTCVPTNLTPSRPPVQQPAPPRSWVSVCPTNLACQLETELWAARLGHCGEDQLISLATCADGLPNSFKFHPFWYINWKEQAWIRKCAARHVAQKVNDPGTLFYMDFGFICASSVDYHCSNVTSDRVIDSYNGYSSYLLIMDNKSSMSWIFLTQSKSPPLELVRLFLCTFGCNRSLGGFIWCNQGGELARSHALIDIWLSRNSATRLNRLALTAHPRMDRLKNGMMSSRSQPAPSSMGLLWNLSIGQLLCSMRPNSTTNTSTPVRVSPPSKDGGVSNQTSSTSNSLVRVYASSKQGIAAPNWTNTTSPDCSLGTSLQTRTFATLTLTVATQKPATMPPSTRHGTSRMPGHQRPNSFINLDSKMTPASPLAHPMVPSQ
jgi:hypothetical protein